MSTPPLCENQAMNTKFIRRPETVGGGTMPLHLHPPFPWTEDGRGIKRSPSSPWPSLRGEGDVVPASGDGGRFDLARDQGAQ